MIQVQHLTKRYGDHYAVQDLDFTVEDGQIYGLLGPNGAGKTTTMNILTGYTSASEGRVTIDGHDILEEPLAAKACIGYLPEIPPLYVDMTVREYLLFVAELKKVKPKAQRLAQLETVVARAGLDEMEQRLIRNLSKGYRQRVGLAAALLGQPRVIILDEPTVGLDPAQMMEMRSLIRELGKTHTVILSSHILSEVQAVCDRVLIIAHGKLIAQGTPAQLAGQLAAQGAITATAGGSREQVLQAAQSVVGLDKIAVTAEAGGEVTFTAMVENGADLRAALSAALAAAGCPVLALSKEAVSLEEVFLQLTEAAEETETAEEAADMEAAEATEAAKVTEQTEAAAQEEKPLPDTEEKEDAAAEQAAPEKDNQTGKAGETGNAEKAGKDEKTDQGKKGGGQA